MTQVDFYILEQAQPREVFACRVAEKAYLQGQNVYIYTETPQQAQAMDDLLWTFRPGSFVPHGQAGAGDAAPVTVATQPPAPGQDQVLINLAREVPAFYPAFQRVVEVVDQDEQTRLLGRERFRRYREQGINPLTHNL